MTSWRSESFKKDFAKLPPSLRDLADITYELWKNAPFHASLHFKNLGNNIWSVRIGRRHRALGVKNDSEIVWFWIGSHADYDKLYGSTKALEKGQKMQQQVQQKGDQPKSRSTSATRKQ